MLTFSKVKHFALLLVFIMATHATPLVAEDGKFTVRDPITGKVTTRNYGSDNADIASILAMANTSGLSKVNQLASQAAALARFEGYNVSSGSEFILTNVPFNSSEKFEQKISGIPVYGAQLIISRSDSGNIKSAVFKISEASLNSTTPAVSPKEIESIAQSFYPSYIGKILVVETPELVVFDPYIVNKIEISGAYLAWKVNVNLKHGKLSDNLIIDATNGSLLFKVSRINDDINRKIYDCSFGDGNCYLDGYYGPFNYFYGRSEGQPVRGPNPEGADPFFQGFPQQVDQLYDLLGGVNDYYNVTFARNGADGADGIGNGANTGNTVAAMYTYGSLPLVFAAVCPNAFFNPTAYTISNLRGFLVFCAGLAVHDVVGHEYTHAVIEYSLPPDGLIYQGESGALNEGLADIYGEAVQRFLTGSSNWIIGSTGILELRNLVDPESASYPATVHSANFYCGVEDQGGVHTNSAVIGHAAKLMALGGTNNGCTINAIGYQKQEAIFYRALTEYFTSTTTFAQAHAAVMLACYDLYGAASVECRETAKALNAGWMDKPTRCVNATTPAAPDCDNCPLDPLKSEPTICGCGVADTNTDGDSLADCFDQCDTDPTKTTTGLCGCGIAETNTDGDGLPDCVDQCPSDPAKVISGACGCGLQDIDRNRDLLFDCPNARAFARSLTPRFGALAGGRAKITMTLEKFTGSNLYYEITITGPNRYKKVVNGTSNRFTLRNLSTKGRYRVKFKLIQKPRNRPSVSGRTSSTLQVSVT